MTKLKLNPDRYLLFAILCGIVATLWRYSFGEGDQLDHLLFIKKAINPDFLSNDAYVSLAGSFTVRYYFAHFVAWFASLFGISVTCFIFTLLANVFTAFATFKVAKFISKSNFSGLVACIFVMTVTTINMGDVPTIYATGIAPDRLAFPLVLLAFYYALKEKPIYVAFFAGYASIFHIMLGAVGGGVFLGALFITNVLLKNKLNWSNYFKSLALHSGFLLFTLVPYFYANSESISAPEFIQIYAHFRVPHHLVPSYIFANGILLRSLAFFIAASIAGFLLYKNKIVETKHIHFFIITAGLFFVLCFFGYLFIEVFPSRIGVFLQAFRYLTLVKWMAFILLGTYVGKVLSERRSLVSGLYLFASVLYPFLMCFSFCFEAFYRFTKLLRPKIKYLPLMGLFLVLSYLGYKALNPETLVLVIYLFLILAYLYFTKTVAKILLLTSVIFIIINIAWISKADPNNNWFTQNFNPGFSFDANASAKVDMAFKIKQITPEHSILLAPSNFLEARTIGERASVVCFKTVPFTDMEIKDWKQRLGFCYGATKEIGFDAEQDLIKNYKEIEDTDLLRIQEKYGICYAVLYDSTKTNFKIVYQNQEYKLLEVCD